MPKIDVAKLEVHSGSGYPAPFQALYLEVGTRLAREHVHYPDDDLVLIRDDEGRRALHKSGEPWR